MTTITLVDNGAKRYALIATNKVLGRMYDNISEEITVIRPASESGRTCTMLVTGSQSGCYQAKTIDQINVGSEPIKIRDVISQYSEVQIGFSFSDETGYIKNSEIETFAFLPAQKPNDWQPDEPEVKHNLNDLINKGFVDVSWKVGERNTLVFKNLKGEIVDEIELSPFVQEQSNLAETDTTKETFVKNKSTKYLTNEGNDGTSPYATEKYVQDNGGKIDVIAVNNVDQPIVNKRVNITIPDPTINETVVQDTSVVIDGESVSLKNEYVDLATRAKSEELKTISLADDNNAGMMASADYKQIRDNTSRIENLEAKTTRLLYPSTTIMSDVSISSATTLKVGSRLAVGSILNGVILDEIKEISVDTDMANGDLIVTSSVVANGSEINQVMKPMQDDIQSFVDDLGYESPYAGIAVVVADTFHIWHYYQNGGIGWRDDGLDTVSQFTNEIAGVIKGANTDGSVYAETDGTGSVFGWNALKTRVANLETAKINRVVLVYDGTKITKGGVAQTFADIQTLVNSASNFVEVNATNLNIVMRYVAYEDDAIWFGSQYKIDGINYLNRLIINSNNEVLFDDDGMQGLLISGTNIKTINGQSVLGGGNLDVGGAVDNTTITKNANNELQAIALTNGTSTMTFEQIYNAMSIERTVE